MATRIGVAGTDPFAAAPEGEFSSTLAKISLASSLLGWTV